MTNPDHRILGILVASLVVLFAVLARVTPTGGGRGPAEQTPRDWPREQPLEEAESPTPPRVGLWTPSPPANDPDPGVPPDGPDPATQAKAPEPGAFAEILADYGEIGFDQYRASLARIGARFFVVRRPTFGVVAEVDLDDLSFHGIGPMEGLSLRSRDISAEPRLKMLLARASAEFGEGDYAVVALLPVPVERRLMRDLDAIGRAVEAGVDSFVCHYGITDGDLVLEVSEIRSKDGQTVAVDAAVILGALDGSTGASGQASPR